MNAAETNVLLQHLANLWEQCPDMRLGQLMATLGLLAEDAGGHSLWDIEDDELLTAIEQFSEELAQRGHVIAPAAASHASRQR